MTTEDMKRWIDEAEYEQLLRRWRNSPGGDPIFQGEIGQYYSRVMATKRAEVGDEGAFMASKKIGWRWEDE